MKESNFVVLAVLLICNFGYSQKKTKSKKVEVCCVPASTSAASVHAETISAKDINISAVENKEKMVEVAPPKAVVQEPVKTQAKVVEKPSPQQATANLHDAFDALLKKYVSTSGKVNYKDLKENKADLEAYTKALSENIPADKAPKAERFAYWINAYNAFTLKLIVDNYPLSSVTKLDGGKPWDVKRITLGGKKYSLNDIENNILRPMGDARIHFAINCAAKSCPPIHNVAFTAANLNSVLESRTKRFINDTKANSLTGNELKISKIFDWYGKDFDKIPEFINRFAVTKVKADAKIGFMDYDWSLNE